MSKIIPATNCTVCGEGLEGVAVCPSCHEIETAALKEDVALLNDALDLIFEYIEVPDGVCDEYAGSDYCEANCGDGGKNCVVFWAKYRRARVQQILEKE